MRLDHLLSKEHLTITVPRVCGCSGVVRSTPVAQTIVLRRVLTGGISANRCLAARAGSKYGRVPFGGPVVERSPERRCWVVFGTLLGPEATGPRPAGRVCLLLGGCAGCGVWGWFVSGFLAAPIMHGGCFLRDRLVCGVCGTGLLFENYIVDASIFYKKQFPRI